MLQRDIAWVVWCVAQEKHVDVLTKIHRVEENLTKSLWVFSDSSFIIVIFFAAAAPRFAIVCSYYCCYSFLTEQYTNGTIFIMNFFQSIFCIIFLFFYCLRELKRVARRRGWVGGELLCHCDLWPPFHNSYTDFHCHDKYKRSAFLRCI